ncbi:MAG: biotin--[acetyl-CoA-carboxylase] ligase [Bacteroidales bacterium]
MIIGSEIIFKKNDESTNNSALKLLRDSSPPEGTVIHTNYQIAGRGQKGNAWESEDGKNLLFSIILYPESVSPESQFILSMAISLGVLDYLRGFTTSARIKWPNDICVNNDKIAGILIENSILNDRIVNSVAGIGFNLNQTQFREYVPRAVSLKMIAGRDFETGHAMKELLGCIDLRYKQVLAGKDQQIRKDYHSALYRIMEWHDYKTASGTFNGRIISVKDSGILRIEDRSADIREFMFREIEFTG